MRILGIDPGPVESGYAILANGHLSKFGKVPSGDLVEALGHFKSAYQLDQVACECVVGQGNRVGSDIFETCRYEGRIEQECFRWNLDLRRVRRVDVRVYLCNSIRAGDPDVRAELIHRFGTPGRKSSPGATFGMTGDMWAALGVAVFASEVPQDPACSWDGRRQA